MKLVLTVGVGLLDYASDYGLLVWVEILGETVV
jgi:hypothetical protein